LGRKKLSTIEDFIEDCEFSDIITEETILVHDADKNTLIADIIITMKTPDGQRWESDRTVKVAMHRVK